MTITISVENISKFYRLGAIGGGTLAGDLNRWWARLHGRPDPLLKVDQADHGNRQGEFVWALKDVNFDVQQGQAVGIIGRNGAGKSTLLKILSRVTAPTSGLIRAKGRVASLLEVGTGFHPELTGKENIYLNGAILGMSRAEVRRKLDEIVAFADIDQFMDTPVKRYSSGMYVRLAFAVAAHLEPDILVVDEVLAVGDAEFQKKCLGKMEGVTRAGRTVLFVSHNMSAVAALCERAIWFENGGLRSDGPATEIIDAYLGSTLAKNRQRDGFFPLHDRSDRRGAGGVKLTHIQLMDSDNNCVSGFKSGQRVRLAFGYEMPLDTKPDEVLLGFTLSNSYFQHLAFCRNDISGEKLSNLPSSGEVICEFPNLQLAPGRYFISAGIVAGRTRSDKIDQAAEFEVIMGDYYPTKLLPQPGYGPLLLNYKWSWRENDLYEDKRSGTIN